MRGSLIYLWAKEDFVYKTKVSQKSIFKAGALKHTTYHFKHFSPTNHLISSLIDYSLLSRTLALPVE